ncbi:MULTISPECIES: hypothetical protein [Ralstonia]|jgi:hypothetical protein|uniref:Uncharacterized protein n=2 Tax=Ralstonia pickettii TaxID=329 RepID=R0E6Y2_RALPI|nr:MULTISPECIES: hypothetical protein [Ralstonia]ENZ77904.1 hypothetical protein OR214_02180 [Ralstonia pickettii OR214]MCM3581998.1 hypothetical protein [Ralstonia pickettii]
MSTKAKEVKNKERSHSFGEAFGGALKLLRSGPDTEAEWEAREVELHAMVRGSMSGALGVTLARLLVQQPLVLFAGLAGLLLWTCLEAVPFLYHLVA